MVVCGDLAALTATLDAHPELIHATSLRSHGATLLHYSAANGVEDERQRVPPNAVEIADLLISRGADINATSDAYGGGSGSTPLVALVTGGHPNEAGLMEPLVAAYARSGQNLNGAGDDGLPMTYAFLFRNVSAARALARAGARVDNAATAAGMGDLRLLRRLGPPRRTRPCGRVSAFAGLTRKSRQRSRANPWQFGRYGAPSSFGSNSSSERRKASISSGVSSVPSTRPATYSPITGPNLKPSADPPPANQTLSKSG